MNLERRRCVPCEGGVKPLDAGEADRLLLRTPGWIREGSRIHREFKLKDFKEAMAFANRVADLAEEEGHHPDIHVVSWNRVRLDLSTHAIGGLSENDFVIAAKVNQIAGGETT